MYHLLIATFNPAPEMPESEETTTGRRTRPSKRPAREMSAKDSESDDGFENMDVDKSRPGGVPEEPEETDDGQASTPQPLEEEEASTTDEEPKPPPIESSQGRSNEPSDRPAAKTPSAPPPRRELPFVRRAQDGKQSQTQPRPTEDAEETAGETDDDEL